MENKQEAKYIERIEIKGLWGRYDVDWKLNPDVNILVGENGTGKSTILKAVKNVFDILEKASKDISNSNDFNANLYNELTISFKDSNGDSQFTQSHQGRTNGSIHYSDSNSGKLVFIDKLTVASNEYKKELSTLLKNYNICFIKTFDNVQKNGYDDNKSNLDIELNRLEKEYLAYKLKTFRSALKDNKALKANQFFNESIDRLFKPSSKKLNIEDEKISFVLEDSTLLDWTLLSSGEKQLLIILLTVLCQDEKPSILLMDEPEISLDIAWQFELLTIIRTINPNCQLIIVTHSPAIYGKGWRDKVTFIDDIIPQLKKVTA
jgi:predicted ATPase